MSSDECQKVKVQNYEIFASSGEKPVKGLQENVCAVANGLAEKKIISKGSELGKTCIVQEYLKHKAALHIASLHMIRLLRRNQ